MNLVAFPFDVVICNLTFESFNYNTDEVKMKWSANGVKKIRDNIELADYALEDIRTERKEEVQNLCSHIPQQLFPGFCPLVGLPSRILARVDYVLCIQT